MCISLAAEPYMSVKSVTTMLVVPDLVQQSHCRGQYVACALTEDVPGRPDPGLVQAAQAELEAHMAALWRIGWDNMRRETLWRLTVNGVAGAGGHGLSPGGACPCGWVRPDEGLSAEQGAFAWRAHCFWRCTVARGVVTELVTALPLQPPALLCADVWLLRSPTPVVVHPEVWALVCMVALEAMSFGRKAVGHVPRGAESARLPVPQH